MNSLILSVGARLLILPFIGFSIFMLLRGHNAPGGGFVGGLIAAAGVTLYAFAEGVGRARRALRVDPRSLGVLGLVMAIISGILPSLWGGDPFTGIWGHVLGLKLSNVILFDTGVYFAVFGAMLTLVFALEEQG